MRPGTLAASRSVSSSAVVERGVVAGYRLAQSIDGIAAVLAERRRAREIPAEGVDGDRVGPVQAAHEIGDGVGGVDEAAVHVVAGVEEDEDVGADKGVSAALQRGGLADVTLAHQRPRGAVIGDLEGRLVALGEGRDLLRDAVLEDAEVLGLEPVDVAALVVGDGEAEHHHVDLDAEDRAPFLLCGEPLAEAHPNRAGRGHHAHAGETKSAN